MGFSTEHILFFTIASYESFRQLRTVLNVLLQNQTIRLSSNLHDLAYLVKKLSLLDEKVAACSVIRRFLLISLADTAEHTKRDITTTVIPSWHSLMGISLHHALLMEKVYDLSPTLTADGRLTETYVRQHKALKHLLLCGRGWQRMRDMFGISVIALIPTSVSDCGDLNNQRYVQKQCSINTSVF